MVRDVFLVISVGLMFFQGNGISSPTLIHSKGEGFMDQAFTLGRRLGFRV